MKSIQEKLSKIFVQHYKTFYSIAQILTQIGCTFDFRKPKIDLVFVVPETQRGWILEGIAKEIARYFKGSFKFHYSISHLPNASAYFFVHYSTIVSAYRRNPLLFGKKIFVWYTHPRDDLGLNEQELFYLLNKVTRIFCTCKEFSGMLNSRGILSSRLSVILGGADPDLFYKHDRGSGKIGFCTAYYERKSPDMVFSIIKKMPNRNFMLIGKNWRNYNKFEELVSLPNFEYIEADYSEYPQLYAKMDVFVSVSKLEGGPIPLIESMMSNVVPVASRTGFAPDLICDGENGFLFDTDASVDLICQLVERAFLVRNDIRSTVIEYSWKNFAKNVEELMNVV